MPYSLRKSEICYEYKTKHPDQNPTPYRTLTQENRLGETDEFPYQTIRDEVSVHDLHTTILHQSGIDHERLTYPLQGRCYRLTDVQGYVARGLLE